MDNVDFLLVYPKIPETYWSYSHALSFVGKRALMPPLGLATIAAMIPERFSVRILDMNVEDLSDDDLMGAGLVLVSAMIVQRDSFRSIVRRCAELETYVAVGGPYPTSCPEEMQGVDFLIQGEAEEVFPRFLDDFLGGCAGPRYAAARHPDVRDSPTPRFDLVRTELYDTMPLQFSRGCPFDCEFCDIVHLFGNVPRTKRVEQFTAELDAVYATGFRGSIFIVDDNFIGNRREVVPLLRAIRDWQGAHGNPYYLATEASLNLGRDDELLRLMASAGFTMVFVGIESPDKDALAEAKKAQNLRTDIGAAVRKIQAVGIEVTGGFIVGFDADSPSIYDDQIDFVSRLAVPVAMVGLLTALPHTTLHRRLASEGRLVANSSGNNMHTYEMNFVPAQPIETVLAGYRRVLRTIYEPDRYFDRCLELLRRMPAPPRSRATSVHLREVVALFRSLFRQTFSWYGGAYLRFISNALRRFPRRIVNIFTLAVQGHHFFTITRRLTALEGPGSDRAESGGAGVLTVATEPRITYSGRESPIHRS